LGGPAALGRPRPGPVRRHRRAPPRRTRRRAAAPAVRHHPRDRPGPRPAPDGRRGVDVPARTAIPRRQPAGRSIDRREGGGAMKTLAPTEVGRIGTAVLDAVGTVVVGKRQSLELVLSGILAGGHVLLEDLPGLGKTLTARSFAQALGIGFRRLQFTPDLLPADVTGSFLYDQRSHDFTFRAGPVFTNLLLADEINRTPPKTQAALLEAMQERQVSVEGATYRLDPPFHVLATANPIEY